MQPIYVALTLDCERIAAESPPGGPVDWAMSERAISGYAIRLLDQGYPPTLFLIPECAARHSDLLGKLAERGAELGMHAHPQSMFDHRYTRYLGEYDAELQREILGLAAEAIAKAVGKRPASFRPGNFSASDVTYDVLYQLGFRQGSVSDPGRNSPQFAAVWQGAYPDPHYVDPTDKLIVGRLPFLEVPLTTDPERLQPNGFPYELRIESGPFESWHRPIIEKTLRRWERERTPFRALCIFSHNTYAYDDLSEPRTATLQQILDYLGGLGEKLVPVTLEEMHRRFREQKKPH